MRKNYQNQEIDTSHPAVPDTVSVALAELAGEMREGLLALAVGTGLQVMAAIMEQDVTAVCGPKGRHDRNRTATRHGSGAGSVTLGGRRVPVTRPRIRAADGSGELPVPAYELFSSSEILGRMALSDARRAGRVHGRWGALRRTLLRGRPGDRHRRRQAPVVTGRGLHGERDPGDRADRRAAGTGPERHQTDLGCARRLEGATPRGPGRVRPPGDRSLPTPQDL